MTPKAFLIYGIAVCTIYTGLTFSEVAVIDPLSSQQISSDGSDGSSGSGSGHSGGWYRWPNTGYHK